VTRGIALVPLTRDAFAPFGEVIEAAGTASHPINGGMCDRHHAIATAQALGDGARTILSIGHGRPYALPLTLTMLERHPLSSQAWIPLHDRPFAFLTAPRQGVNYRANVWHAPVTPLDAPGDFLIVDRDGPGLNLEEHFFDAPWRIVKTA
jgi:ureidoglycolate lyase